MLNKLFSKLLSKRVAIDYTQTELDYNKLPVLTADELIQFTGQQNRIRKIKRIIQIDEEYFQDFYLDALCTRQK